MNVSGLGGIGGRGGSSGGLTGGSSGDSPLVKYATVGLSVGVGGPSTGVGLPTFQAVIFSDIERDRTRLRTTFDDTPVGLDAPLFDDISVLFAAVVIAYEQNASYRRGGRTNKQNRRNMHFWL